MIVRDIKDSVDIGEYPKIISLREPRSEKVAISRGRKTPPPRTFRAPQKTLLLHDSTTEKSSRRIRELTVLLSMTFAIIFVTTTIYLYSSGIRLKKSVIDAASAGFENILNGATAMQDGYFENAKESFNEAKRAFDAIHHQTWFTAPKIPALTLADPTFESASAITNAGSMLAQAGAKFTDVSSTLHTIPRRIFEGNKYAIAVNQPSLTEQLKKQLPAIFETAELLNKAQNEIQKITPAFIPNQLRDRFNFAKEALASISSFLTNLRTDIPAILALLGDREPHTLLILLQNSAELRPSGGFIGNYMIVETNDGYITKMEVFDAYNADHQLREFIAPPPEIAPVNTRWFMRDSNYSGHFPLSAAKTAWFLEKENGPGVDTIIAINELFIKELLRLTGPVRIPSLPLPLTSENFTTILSYAIEAKITGRQNPKALLKELLPILPQKILSLDPVQMMPLIKAAIESKDILAYSKDPVVEEFFSQHGADGAMKPLEPKEDYLNIVHTSIGGNKSDRYVTEKITHDTYLNADGSIVNDLAITRTHRWNAQVEREIKALVSAFGFSDFTDKLMQILGRSRNLHALRIYVPRGTVLLESSNSEITAHIDEETDKVYFSAQMMTPVGESRTLEIRYKLPFKLNLDPVDKYTLNVQKQPGQRNAVFEKRIFPESQILNYKYFPENGAFDSDGVWNFETQLKSDMNFSSIWGK